MIKYYQSHKGVYHAPLSSEIHAHPPNRELLSFNSFTTQSGLLTTLYKNPFENIVGKEENAGAQHFLLLPQCFLHFLQQISISDSH